MLKVTFSSYLMMTLIEIPQTAMCTALSTRPKEVQYNPEIQMYIAFKES